MKTKLIIHVETICSAFKENKQFRPNFGEDFLDNLCFLYISLEKEVYNPMLHTCLSLLQSWLNKTAHHLRKP